MTMPTAPDDADAEVLRAELTRLSARLAKVEGLLVALYGDQCLGGAIAPVADREPPPVRIPALGSGFIAR
jgi:hypothetical protein